MLTGWAVVRAQELKFCVAEFYLDQQDLSAQEENRDDGDGALYAIIKVTSDNEDGDLNDFSFDFNYLKNSKEMRDGELWVFVQRNAKNVTIRREGYKTVKYALPQTIRAGKTYRMKLSVQQRVVQQRILQFKVTPANESAVVKVKKEDSNEDYQLWGMVDAQGSIDRLLESGEYLYEISAESYKTAQGKVSLINGEGNYIEKVSLTPNFGFLEISDDYGIAGAEVYINNLKVGTIPYKSGRMEPRNDYQLMISNGELFKTYNSTIEIHQGETTIISPRLQSNFAETTIKVEDEAEIFLNGTSKGKGSWKGPLRAGVHDVECRLPNHISSKKQIVVKVDVPETHILDKPTPIEGSLYVKSNPSGAKIFLDGRDLGIVTPNKIDNVLIGAHKVTIMFDNYKQENVDINVNEDEIATVYVDLSNTVIKLTLDNNNLSLKPEGTVQLTPTVYPEFANNKSVTWSSSNTDVATVDNEGNVTAVAGGTATITAQSVSNSNVKATCQVLVAFDRTFTVGGVTFTMKLVEAGTFQMGAITGDGDETPVHSVTISQDYYIGETEVTQALWKAVTGKTPTSGGSAWAKKYGRGNNYPAYYISYEDVLSFITKLNSMTGENFRMPTEAEWEFAARGGNKSKGYTCSGSNTIGDVAWYTNNSSSKTQIIKTKAANELGIYDMSGNVYEWCSDWYGSYSSSAQTDPTGPNIGTRRVLRGGCWAGFAPLCRCADRSSNWPSFRGNYVGFRLAL